MGGFTFATIALTSYHDSPDLISDNTHINPHIQMREYDCNCTSRTNWCDLARTPCWILEPEPLNTFQSIHIILAESIQEELLEVDFWQQSAIPSPWNIHWTDAAAYGGGLELDDPVFGNSWTKYWGAHTWFDCNPQLPWECEEQNCVGTHSTEGHAPAAVESATPALLPLIVIEHSSPTPSEIDAYFWHW